MTASRSAVSSHQRSGRAFRGLGLVFLLSFLNLFGVIVTAAALGGVAPWSRWQFIGLFGVIEGASGLANVISPNVWRLPVAELEKSARTDVKLAPRNALRLRILNQHSTWFSQLARVGV